MRFWGTGLQRISSCEYIHIYSIQNYIYSLFKKNTKGLLGSRHPLRPRRQNKTLTHPKRGNLLTEVTSYSALSRSSLKCKLRLHPDLSNQTAGGAQKSDSTTPMTLILAECDNHSPQFTLWMEFETPQVFYLTMGVEDSRATEQTKGPSVTTVLAFSLKGNTEDYKER